MQIPFAPLPVSGGAVKCGWYAGDSLATRHIDLGVTPKWVGVWMNGQTQFNSVNYEIYGGIATQEKPVYSADFTALQISQGGFDVYYKSPRALSNIDGVKYIYLYGI